MTQALGARAGAHAHIIALALALYGAFITLTAYLSGKPRVLPAFTLTFVPYGLLAAAWFRRHATPAERAQWAHPFVFSVAVLAATRDLIEIRLTQSLTIADLGLLVLGAAVVMLDTRWYACVLGITGLAWASSVLLVGGRTAAYELTLQLVSTAVVGLVMHLALVAVHKQREHALASRQSILDAVGAVGEGYVLTDEQGICEANEAYLRMVGRAHADVLGTDVVEFLHPDDRELARASMRDAVNGSNASVSFEARILREEGSSLAIEASITRTSSSPSRLFSVVRDISLRKEAERQVLATQAMRDKLTTALSHDLRGPLMAIAGFSNLLQHSWSETDTQKRTFLLERISANALEMGEMIDQLLDHSRLEQGWTEIAPRRIGLAAWVDDWCRTKAPLLGEHRIVVDMREDQTIDVDRRALARIVGNLVGNAVKFSPKDSTITIAARTSGDDDELSVADEGKGITADLRDRLFEPFAQVDDADASQGIGMGLAVIKRYVDLHGGRITVQSEPGAGSRFTVHLPQSASVDREASDQLR
jgi:PAS domain S-box-containing protein